LAHPPRFLLADVVNVIIIIRISLCHLGTLCHRKQYAAERLCWTEWTATLEAYSLRPLLYWLPYHHILWPHELIPTAVQPHHWLLLAHYADELALRHLLQPLKSSHVVLGELGALALLHWDELHLLVLELARLCGLGISMSHLWLIVLEELATKILPLALYLELCLEVSTIELCLLLSNRLIIWAHFDLIHSSLLVEKSGLELIKGHGL